MKASCSKIHHSKTDDHRQAEMSSENTFHECMQRGSLRYTGQSQINYRQKMNFLPHLHCLQSLQTDLTEQSHSCQPAAPLLKKYEHMKEVGDHLKVQSQMESGC